MMAWYENLSMRDRRALLLVTTFLLGTGVYFAVWEPLNSGYQRSRELVQERRELVSWMRGAAQEARTLGTRPEARAVPAGGRSLLATVDATVTGARLRGAVKRMEPDGATRVRVWLEQAEFDQVLRWMGELQSKHGVDVLGMRAEPLGAAGRVNARVTFSRSTT